MIPLFKLADLPPSQKLRKSANLVRGAERRFLLKGHLEAGEADYFARLMKLLIEGGGFPPAALEELKAAGEVFAAGEILSPPGFPSAPSPGEKIRRALNNVYQILLVQTGRFQADWDFYESDGTLDAAKRHSFPGMQVYLEDIRSPFNVGSMFRAAESFGAEKIWLSPLSADPRHKRAERTAMGCMDVLPWEQLQTNPFGRADSAGHISDSRADGISPTADFSGPFFALETGGIALEDFPFPQKGILIAGSEELGVSPEALAAADASLGRVSIATWGAKCSLNVSVAFGIVMQAWAASLQN